MSAQSIEGSFNPPIFPASPSQPPKRYTLCSTLSRVGRAIAAIFSAFIHLFSCFQKKLRTKPILEKRNSLPEGAHETSQSLTISAAHNLDTSTLAIDEESKIDGEDETEYLLLRSGRDDGLGSRGRTQHRA